MMAENQRVAQLSTPGQQPSEQYFNYPHLISNYLNLQSG